MCREWLGWLTDSDYPSPTGSDLLRLETGTAWLAIGNAPPVAQETQVASLGMVGSQHSWRSYGYEFPAKMMMTESVGSRYTLPGF